jgi:hypothetical protein
MVTHSRTIWDLASQLFRSDDGAAWTEVAAAPVITALGEPPGRSLGFDAVGKLFTLTNTAGFAGTSDPVVDYLRSTEP